MELLEISPLFDENNLMFFREEKDGYYSMVSKSPTSTEMVKIINGTTKLIMELCDGNNSLKDIIGQLIKKFPNVSQELISKDIVNIITNLHQNGFLTFKQDNNLVQLSKPQQKHSVSSNTFVYKANVTDSVKISKLILDKAESQNDAYLLNLYNRKFTYGKNLLSTRISEESEEVFVLEQNNEIIGVMSINNTCSKFTKSEISMFVIKNDNDLVLNFNRLITFISNDVNSFANKLKVNIISSNEGSNPFEKEILNLGFENEGVFKSEAGDNMAVAVYAKFNQLLN